MKRFRLHTWPILALFILFTPYIATAAPMTYIALGDSVAFGETDFTHNPSFGDRGYVGGYADYLGAINGGVRPKVINLAVDGETTGSFTTGVNRVSPVPALFNDATLAALNLNYTITPPPSQDTLFRSMVTSEQAASRTIGTVSLSLGANDLFALALSPAFNDPNANKPALLMQTLGTIQANYTSLLTEVHGLLPNANLLVVGEYNPFPAVPSSPFAAFAAPAIQGLNTVLAGEALQFGGHYIDSYSVFSGHEAVYTHITDPPAGSNNVHPNALGYAAITLQIEAVPEPGSLLLMGMGVLGLLACRRCRRAER